MVTSSDDDGQRLYAAPSHTDVCMQHQVIPTFVCSTKSFTWLMVPSVDSMERAAMPTTCMPQMPTRPNVNPAMHVRKICGQRKV
jgi:hypothetical protein